MWCRSQDAAPNVALHPEAPTTAKRTKGQEHAKAPASRKKNPAKGEGAEKKKSSTSAKRRGKLLDSAGKTRGEGGKDTLNGGVSAGAFSCGVRLTGLWAKATSSVTRCAAAAAKLVPVRAGTARDIAGATRRRAIARRFAHGSETRVVWLCVVLAVVVALTALRERGISSRTRSAGQMSTLSAQMGRAIDALRENVASARAQQAGCRDIWSLSLVHRGKVADLRLATRDVTALRDALTTHSQHTGVQENCCGAVANLGADNVDAQVLRKTRASSRPLLCCFYSSSAVEHPCACVAAVSCL